MTSADVTRRELTLGNIDLITGWYRKTFANTIIPGVLLPKGHSFSAHGMGYYARYDWSMFTADVMNEGDQIISAANDYFEVEGKEPFYWLDQFSHYECALTYLPPFYATRPVTYGIGSTVEDPRHRTKDFLDTYIGAIAATHLTEDDGTAPVNYIVSWADPDYPMARLFNPLEKDLDLVFTVAEPNSEPIPQFDKTPCGFLEHMPIKVFTIDKATITGLNLQWKAAQALREVVTAQPYGSLRTVGKTKPSTLFLGSPTVYSTEFMMDYRRGLT